MRPHRSLVRIAVATLAPVLAMAFLWATLRVTDDAIWQHAPLGWIGLFPARLGLLTASTASLLVGCIVAVAQARAAWLRRLAVAAFTVLMTSELLEVVFMFVPRSHSVGYTLASNIWWERHWGPLNSLGYRDVEPVRASGRKLVFAIGDSFTAGAGIADRSARFGDRIERHHPQLQVMNLGRNGSDSADEFTRLQAHPLQPDAVVLQYYPNDIEGAAQRAGRQRPQFRPYEDLASVKLRLVVRGSYLANFVYWQFEHGDGTGYLRYLEAAFADADVVQRHVADLEQFCSWTREHRMPLVVVMFPLLEDLEGSRRLTAPVARLFYEQHVPLVDVAELVADLPVAARTVNSHDGHASIVVNERVAAAIAKLLLP